MTALLNLAAHARVGRLAVVAAALVIGIVALGAPAVTEAAGASQADGAHEGFAYLMLVFGLELVVGGLATAGDALAGLTAQAGL